MNLLEKYKSIVKAKQDEIKLTCSISPEQADGSKAVKVYSKILDAYLWVVADEKMIDELRAEGESDPYYTKDEIMEIKDKGLSKEALKGIHEVKKVFDKGIVSKIENK